MNGQMFAQALLLGDDLLQWLALAFGGALLAGNVAAFVKPPERRDPDSNDLEKPPIIRTVVYAVIGLVMTIWALGSLVSG